MIDRGPPLDPLVEAELKAACASVAEGLKPTRIVEQDRRRRHGSGLAKQQKSHHNVVRDVELPQRAPSATHSRSTSNAAVPIMYHAQRDMNSSTTLQKPRTVITDSFPDQEGIENEIPADINARQQDLSLPHPISDVPSLSPHTSYHQFIRNIGPGSSTELNRMDIDPKPVNTKIRRSFESSNTESSMMRPSAPINAEYSTQSHKKPSKQKLYLEQVYDSHSTNDNAGGRFYASEKRRVPNGDAKAAYKPPKMSSRTFDPTFEEVRQERQSILRPMSAQSVRPKREVPQTRSSSAVGWHEPTLNSRISNHYSISDTYRATQNRSISPIKDSQQKPKVTKIDLNRALPPLPKIDPWDEDPADHRRSHVRTHIANLIQPDYRERAVVNNQNTDGQLYLQIMSRIEEINRAPIDAPPPLKDASMAPQPQPMRRPFSALGYHASLREIEYGKRSRGRSKRAAEQQQEKQQQQQQQHQHQQKLSQQPQQQQPKPASRPPRAGLPKALDPAVPPVEEGSAPTHASNKNSRARSTSQSQQNNNNAPLENNPKSKRPAPAYDAPHHSRSNSHNNNYSHHYHNDNGHLIKPSNKRPQRNANPLAYNNKTYARQADPMTEFNNFIKPKVLAELGYTRRISVEHPDVLSDNVNGADKVRCSNENMEYAYGGNGGGGNNSYNSNSNNSNHYNSKYNNNSNNNEEQYFKAMKRVFGHVALGRKSMKRSGKEGKGPGMTWMDRIESQGVKRGVMVLDDVANAPVVRF